MCKKHVYTMIFTIATKKTPKIIIRKDKKIYFLCFLRQQTLINSAKYFYSMLCALGSPLEFTQI